MILLLIFLGTIIYVFVHMLKDDIKNLRKKKQEMKESGNPYSKKVSPKGEVKEGGKKWIQKAIDPKKKGQLHKDLGVPQDQTIPVSKLKAAAEKGGVVGKRAQFALNIRKEK